MMNKKVIILVLMLIVLFSCNKDNEFDFALIQTGDVTNIDSTGATFHARISDISNADIIEYGFVWNTSGNPEIYNSEKYKIAGSPSIGLMSERIYTTLEKNVTYYVRAFIQNRNYITYGKEVAFTSLGSTSPAISGFTFKSGTNIDTIIIYGHNFSYLDNNVHFNETKGNVLKATQDSLITILPDTIYHNLEKISVTVSGNKTEYNTIFNIMSESSFTISEKFETFGNYITITSNEINYTKGSLRVLFNNIISKPIYLDNKNIRVQIPENLNKRTPNITIISERNRSVIHNQFSLAALEILDFNPKVILTGEKVTLTGNNFSPIPENNIILVGGIPAEVINASINKLEIIVPLQDNGVYPDRNVNLSIEVIEENKTFYETLLINDKWFRLSDAPISTNGSGYLSEYKLANCFINNTKAYIGLNNKSEFWEYDPIQDKWKKLSDFPGTPRRYGNGFVIEDKIYFGTGAGNANDLTDWWEYEISLDKWTQKNDFTGGKRTGAVSFKIDNTGFIGTGFKLYPLYFYDHGYTDFWKYSPLNDSWTLVTNYPMFDNFGMWWGIALANNTEAYMGLGNVTISGDYEKWMYRYEPSSNSWSRIANYPYADLNNRAIGFELEEDIYIKTSYSNDFYYYNSLSDSWSKIQTDILYDFEMGVAFSVGSKAYVGLGRENQMWEYDPNRQ